MGQTDVIDWLREQRLSKQTKDLFFSARDIETALRERGVSVLRIRPQLNALYLYGYLEVLVDTGFKRSYRLKLKYVKEGSKAW